MPMIEIPAITGAEFGQLAMELSQAASVPGAAWQKVGAFQSIAQALASGTMKLVAVEEPQNDLGLCKV